MPVGNIVCLKKADHSRAHMFGTVVTRLEALKPAGRTLAGNHIFALVTVGAEGGRQALTLDRNQALIVVIFPTVDPDNVPSRARDKVDRAATIGFVGLLSAKLQEVPTGRVTTQAVKTAA